MAGVEYAAIKPGDLSPGGMNVDMDNADQLADVVNQSAAAETDDPNEKRRKIMANLKKTKELRKNMKR